VNASGLERPGNQKRGILARTPPARAADWAPAFAFDEPASCSPGRFGTLNLAFFAVALRPLLCARRPPAHPLAVVNDQVSERFTSFLTYLRRVPANLQSCALLCCTDLSLVP
jgi:hypothetical protein